jgi:hypothetical protein
MRKIGKPLRKIGKRARKIGLRVRKIGFWARKIPIFRRDSLASGNFGVSFCYQICYQVCAWIYFAELKYSQLKINHHSDTPSTKGDWRWNLQWCVFKGCQVTRGSSLGAFSSNNIHSARPNLSKIWAHRHRCISVRQLSRAHPQHLKVLKHFIYMFCQSWMSLRYY